MSAGRQAAPSTAPPPRPGPLHLLWALPVALAAAIVITVVAGIAACGVSGCSGGGFGPVGDRRLLAAVLLLVAGAVLATPLVVVGWARRRTVRLEAAAAVAVGWAASAWLTITGIIV